MPAPRSPAKKPAVRKSTSKTSARPAVTPAKGKRAPAPKAAGQKTRMTLAQVMAALEKAGSAQARKTYLRHGAREPLFGVSFATLAGLVKQIGVDHDLALALWETGNFDARNLAFKVADPARLTPDDLDRWARETLARMCGGYVAMLAQEGPHAFPTAQRWLASPEELVRCAGWGVVAQMAARDATIPDAWFAERVTQIQTSLPQAPNDERYAMNGALIQIGGRSPALRKAALAAAKRIGTVEVDHGDTSCKTPDAAAYIEKMWAQSTSKGFDSPAAQERKREIPRTRC